MTVAWTLERLQTAAPKLAHAVRRVDPQLAVDAPLSPDVIETANARLPRNATDRAFALRLVERLSMPGAIGCAPTVAAIIAGQQAAVATPSVGEALDWSSGGIAEGSTIGGNAAAVTCAIAQKDGTIWTLDKEGYATHWDADAKQLFRIATSATQQDKLAVLSDGRIAITSGRDISLWTTDSANATPLATCTDHTANVKEIVPCFDGFASIAEDNTLRLWSPDGTCIESFTFDKVPKALAVSGDLIVVALSDLSLQIHSRRNPQAFTRVEGPTKRQVECIAFLDNGNFVTASADGFVRTWSRIGKELASVQAAKTTISGLIPLRGNQVATVTGEALGIWSSDLASLGTVRRAETSFRGASALADGRLVTFGFVPRTSRVWRPA